MKKILLATLMSLISFAVMCFITCHKQGDSNLKIGLVVALTGPSSATGVPTANAVKMLMSKYSDVTFYVEDSKSTVLGGMHAAQRLVELHDVDAIYCDLSNVSAAIVNYTETKHVLLMAPIILDGFITKNQYTIRNFMTLDKQVEIVLQEYFHRRDIGDKLIAVVSNDEFGKSSLAGLRICLTEKRFERLAMAKSFDFGNDHDEIRDVATAVVSERPDVIFVSSFSSSLGTMIKALRNNGYQGVILTTTAFTVPEIQRLAGACKDVVFADLKKSETYYEIRKMYEGMFFSEPPLTTYLCYNGISLLAETYRRFGTADPAELVDKIHAVTMEGTYGRLNVENREVCYRLVADSVK